MIQSYNDLPIGKYLDILALDKDGLSDLDYQVAVVGILADLTPDEVLDLPLPEYQKHVAAAQFLTAPVLGKDGRSPYDGKRVPQSYTLAGLQLDLTTKAEKMTAAQYIDFQTFAKEPVKHQAELLSCVLIPHGKTYNDGYEITDVHKAIRENLSVAECYALSAFFFEGVRRLHAAYPILFAMDAQEETPQDEGGEGTAAEDRPADSFTERWGWVANIDAVAELTHESWSAVWQMNIVEFFNLISYRRDKLQRQKENIEQWKRTH